MPCQTPETDEIEVTPEMVAAGVERLTDLEGCAGPTFLVREVFAAMEAASTERDGKRQETQTQTKEGEACRLSGLFVPMNTKHRRWRSKIVRWAARLLRVPIAIDQAYFR